MSVLDRLANGDEHFQPFARSQFVAIAVVCDRHPLDQFHRKIRAARVGRSSIQHLGDVVVIHHRECLAFGFEPRDHLAAVHARFDDFQRDFAANGPFLLGHVNRAHAALTDLLQQLVRTDDRTRSFQDRLADFRGFISSRQLGKSTGLAQEFTTQLTVFQMNGDLLEASLVQFSPCELQQFLFARMVRIHR